MTTLSEILATCTDEGILFSTDQKPKTKIHVPQDKFDSVMLEMEEDGCALLELDCVNNKVLAHLINKLIHNNFPYRVNKKTVTVAIDLKTWCPHTSSDTDLSVSDEDGSEEQIDGELSNSSSDSVCDEHSGAASSMVSEKLCVLELDAYSSSEEDT